jgi:tRNA G46 methylase TrmB
MYANSSLVTSRQDGPHQHLHAAVARHALHPFRQPIAPRNRTAFEESIARWRALGEAALIIDAGCGVGLSTMHLAMAYPDHFVIGVDQSADRIARRTQWQGAAPPNCLRVRANLIDYWRLLLASGIRPARHYLLYPNPWPKSRHLTRRWHGHPVFPALVALGGQLECRSNWHVYVEEFASALTQVAQQPAHCEAFVPQCPITPFERKYLDSGHRLWRCRAQLAASTCPAASS